MKIFIKTCKKDLIWLNYCLQSIHKYGPEFEVIIICDYSGKTELEQMNTYGAKIDYVQDQDNGYIYQQLIKLNAFNWVHDDHILFVDSDCVFFKEFSLKDYTYEGKLLWLKTKYGNLANGEVWKGITEHYIGRTVVWEYMRRLPMIIHRETLLGIQERYPNLNNQLLQLRTKAFSEFNVMGAYAEIYNHDRYSFVDTEVYLPPKVAEQFWSWGGITEDIKTKIESMLA